MRFHFLYTIVFLASICLGASHGFCQQKTAKEELIALSEAQKKFKAYTVEMQYNLYETYHSKDVIEKQTAFVQKDRNQLNHSFVNYFELIQNKSHIVMVNHIEKVVYVQKNFNKTSELPYPDVTKFDFDSLMAKTGVTYHVFEKENDQRKIILRFNEQSSQFSGIDILYSPKKAYAIDKYVLYYNQALAEAEDQKAATKPRLEILCKDFQQYSSLPSHTFDCSAIVALRDKAFSLTPKYQSYRLFIQ
jgi:outer membrane lipoprotein-sorting protein